MRCPSNLRVLCCRVLCSGTTCVAGWEAWESTHRSSLDLWELSAYAPSSSRSSASKSSMARLVSSSRRASSAHAQLALIFCHYHSSENGNGAMPRGYRVVLAADLLFLCDRPTYVLVVKSQSAPS